MSDLFDIANLITTVGVGGVKIKSEPGLPEKSSNEILTELFSTFNADEGVVSPSSSDKQVPDAVIKVEREERTQTEKKKRKSKKKHKHKEKKHKKKSKHNSSDSSSDVENGGKKKKKHKKKSKRKHESSDSDEPKSKHVRKESGILDVAEKKSNGTSLLDKKHINDIVVVKTENDKSRTDSPRLPPISKKIEDEFEDVVLPKVLERPKQLTQGKIQIKNLKNSAVYNETVKEIEIKEKAKAARMEDGELSDSSTDNRTPTLSPTPPPHTLYRSPSLSPVDKTQARAISPSLKFGNDLRLVLREKEKKRHDTVDKSKIYLDKDCKDSKSHKRNRSGKRSRSCHSQERHRSESQTRTSSHRSRSRGRERLSGRSRERWERDKSSERQEASKNRERKRHKSRSRDRSRDRSKDRYSHGRSRSRERKERIEIDKKKLLEIARRNAINMIKQGTLPLAQQDKAIAAIQAGGKTVDELTDFCKSLSKSEALGELSNISSSEDGSESEKGFHHPFLLKERPSSIVMNIRNAKQLPTKTFQEKTAESSNQLRLQFPVSSGQLHRKTENEWIPVLPKKPEQKKVFVAASTPIEPSPVMPAPTPIQSVQPVQPIQSVQSIQPIQPIQQVQQVQQVQPIQPLQPMQPMQAMQPMQSMQLIQPVLFRQAPTTEPVDIGSIMSQRLVAMKKLKENPNDVCALNQMYRVQNEMRSWAESKQMLGQFTGSTGAKVLSPAELTSGYQAWARKDQLVSAQPVSGGMGMALLQKMGWRPGEGLGKNKEGTLEPLQLEIKLDKKGLVSELDIGQKVNKATKPIIPTIKTLEGKHPVSLLGEYCSKRKLGAPIYELCFECGPDHRKNFLFKVKVDGVEYKPTVASPNKKQAKAEAAQVCLQTLGLLPS